MTLTVHAVWREVGTGRDKWAALGRDVIGDALVMDKLRLKTLCKLLKRKKDPDSQWVVDTEDHALLVTWPGGRIRFRLRPWAPYMEGTIKWVCG